MTEKRKYIRIPNSSEIKYTVYGDSKSYSSVIYNISPGGVCFIAKDSIPVGTILKLTFAYEKYFYGGSAKVIWVRLDSEDKYRVGAEFINNPKLPENLIGLIERKRLKIT